MKLYVFKVIICCCPIRTFLCDQLVRKSPQIYHLFIAHTDKLNHVCRAMMLNTSAPSQIQQRAGKMLLERDRQMHRQGDERHKAGLVDGRVMMRGEREGTAHGTSPSFICIPVRVLSPIFSPSLSFAHCPSSSLSLFLSLSSYSMTSLLPLFRLGCFFL